MRWDKLIFGIMVFVLALTCPHKLVALFLEVVGVTKLVGTWAHDFLSYLLCGVSFRAGLGWLIDAIKSMIKGGGGS